MDAPPIKYATTKDGYSIAYCDVGEGPALVWMPLTWNEQNFVWTGPMAPAYHWLARDYRVITYDARGQGSSSRGLRGDHSLLDYVLDLEALVEQLDLEDVVIFGFYYYNTVALLYAAQHPGQVRALVLRSTSFDMSGSPHWLKLAEDSWDMLLYGQAQTWFRTRPPNEIATRMRGWYTQSDFIKMARAAMYHDHKAAPLPQVPTLVMAGTDQPPHWLDAAKVIAAFSPNARLHMDQTGGWFWSGNPIDPLPPGLKMLQEFLHEAVPSSGKSGVLAADLRLTPREREVLRLIAAGRSTREISDDLVLSERTVARHITNLYGKIGAHSRAEATAFAIHSRLD